MHKQSSLIELPVFSCFRRRTPHQIESDLTSDPINAFLMTYSHVKMDKEALGTTLSNMKTRLMRTHFSPNLVSPHAEMGTTQKLSSAASNL